MINSNYLTLRKNAEESRKIGNYEEALYIYKEIRQEYPEQVTKWDGWGYAFCLKKSGKLMEAIEISKEVYLKDKKFSYNNNLLGWSLYEQYIKRNNDEEQKDEQKFLNIAEFITQIVISEKYSPYDITVISVLKYLKGKNNFPVEDIKYWLNKLNSKDLSEDGHTLEIKGRRINLPSQKEEWFSLMAKVLSIEGKYEDCKILIEQALLEISVFHGETEFWIKYRHAICQKELGNIDEARQEFTKLMELKNHWAILSQIAATYNLQEEADDCLLYSLKGILTGEDYVQKINLIFSIGEMFAGREKMKVAHDHFLYYLHLRKAQGWKIPKQHLEVLYLYQVDPEKNDFILEWQMIKKLKDIWIKELFSLIKYETGEIKNLLSNGRSGFIESRGKRFYFRNSSFLGKKNEMQLGRNVKFLIKKSFDQKKDRLSEEAVYIIGK